MPADEHAQPPPGHAIRQALDEWALAEIAATLRPCRELTLQERTAKRQADRKMQREMEERQAAAALPRVVDQPESECTGISTACAENQAQAAPDSGRECA